MGFFETSKFFYKKFISKNIFLQQKLKSTTPGPYLIIGDNWGGSIALELGRQLESLGERVHVFLLSGTPFEVLESIKSIGEDVKSIELGLLKRSFELSNNKVKTSKLNFKNLLGPRKILSVFSNCTH